MGYVESGECGTMGKMGKLETWQYPFLVCGCPSATEEKRPLVETPSGCTGDLLELQ